MVKIWFEKTSTEWSSLHSSSEHDSSVNCVEWAPFLLGPKLAACSSDGYFSILEQRNDKWECTKVDAHDNKPVNSISWAPINFASQPDELCSLVTASSDKSLKVWIQAKDRLKFETKETIVDAHDDFIRCVSWNPSPLFKRNVIASCSEDKQLKIWVSDLEGCNY